MPIVKEFNSLVKNAIIGPDCTNLDICNGKCCFIHLDIPKALAMYYIQNKLATKNDFTRGTQFSFKVKVNLQKGRCVFFNECINGCRLHDSGMKIPQCWVYPTGLDPDDVEQACKIRDGWSIAQPAIALKAQKLLNKYVHLSKVEAQHETSPNEILKRLNTTNFEELQNFPPHTIAGIQDSWNRFIFDINQGFNLALSNFCDNIPCKYEFLTCPKTCDNLIQEIKQFLFQNVSNYIDERGFKPVYSFIEIFEWISE